MPFVQQVVSLPRMIASGTAEQKKTKKTCTAKKVRGQEHSLMNRINDTATRTWALMPGQNLLVILCNHFFYVSQFIVEIFTAVLLFTVIRIRLQGRKKKSGQNSLEVTDPILPLSQVNFYRKYFQCSFSPSTCITQTHIFQMIKVEILKTYRTFDVNKHLEPKKECRTSMTYASHTLYFCGLYASRS